MNKLSLLDQALINKIVEVQEENLISEIFRKQNKRVINKEIKQRSKV